MKSFPSQWQEPWAITGEGGAKLLQAWSARDFLPHAHAARRELAISGGEVLRKGDGRARVFGSVAVIPMYGAMFRHADWMESMCGGRSYESLLSDVDAALQDSRVRSIVLDVDSPGGEANGCFETSERIAAADRIKPIEAFVGGYGASAAWALPCGARRITAHASAFVGCIGVRLVLVDTSKLDEAMGLRYVELVSKRAPDKRGMDVDDALIARLQSRIDGLEDEFINWVAARRGVTAKVVAEDFGRGDVIMGRQAIDVGMVDALGSLDDVIARLQSDGGYHSNGPTARAARKESTMLTTGSAGATMGGAECDGCGKQMADSDKIYCGGCGAGEDAKALGLPEGASASERRVRIEALAGLEKSLFEVTGATSGPAALARVSTLSESHEQLGTVREKLAQLEGEGRKRDLRAVLESGISSTRLSPGRIQKSLALVLRGEARTAWDKAMASLDGEVTIEGVISAACSVPLSADDVAAIGEYAKNADQVAAETFIQPPRHPSAESGELDAMASQVATIAAEIRRQEEARAQTQAVK